MNQIMYKKLMYKKINVNKVLYETLTNTSFYFKSMRSLFKSAKNTKGHVDPPCLCPAELVS